MTADKLTRDVQDLVPSSHVIEKKLLLLHMKFLLAYAGCWNKKLLKLEKPLQLTAIPHLLLNV